MYKSNKELTLTTLELIYVSALVYICLCFSKGVGLSFPDCFEFPGCFCFDGNSYGGVGAAMPAAGIEPRKHGDAGKLAFKSDTYKRCMAGTLRSSVTNRKSLVIYQIIIQNFNYVN